ARVWDMYYPEIRFSKVQQVRPRHADDWFDVLILGGSVVAAGYGEVQEHLSRRLHDAVGGQFRICNLARPAHTSRDSLLKYSRLAGEQFEVVIVYDGINDVPMNCCPREKFRDDYTHFAWYYGFQKKLELGQASLPPDLVEFRVLMTGHLR